MGGVYAPIHTVIFTLILVLSIEITLVDIAASLPLVLPLLRHWKKPPQSGVSYPMKRQYGIKSRTSIFTKDRGNSSGDLEEEVNFARPIEQLSEDNDNRKQAIERITLERQESYNTLNGNPSTRQAD